MKKLLLSLCLIMALGCGAEAQVRRPMPPHHRPIKRTAPMHQPRMNPEHTFNPFGNFYFHVIGELGVRDLGVLIRHNLPYHFSLGGMVENRFGHFTSIGIGAEYYATSGSECHTLWNMQEDFIHTLPIYANLRFTNREAPVFPFVEGRIGYSAPLGSVTCGSPNEIRHYKSAGLYTGLGAGVKIYDFNVSFGMSTIDLVDSDQGRPRKDVITDYYIRLSYAF